MNVYIVEFPAGERDREDGVQVFLHSDDKDICSVLSASNPTERGMALNHIPEPKQHGIIIRQAMKRTGDRDAFVTF